MISTLTVETAAPTKDLTLLATAKAELGTADAEDDALSEVISQASETISAYCNLPRGFGRETLEETFLGIGGEPELLLSGRIGVVVSSVAVDGVELSADDYIASPNGILYRVNAGFVVDWCGQNAVVAYQSGYTLLTTLPRDIERCCLDLVSRVWAYRGRDPSLRSYEVPDVERMTFMDVNRQNFEGGIPDDIAARLDPYRAVSI